MVIGLGLGLGLCSSRAPESGTPEPHAPLLADYHDSTEEETLVGDVKRHNPLARIVLTTTGTDLELVYVSDGVATANIRHIAVFSNGALVEDVATTADSAPHTVNVTLPGGSQTVEIWEGPQLGVEPTATSGGIITSVEVTDATMTIVEPTPPAHRVVVYGDSISQGYPLTLEKGWTALLRLDGTFDGQVTIYGAVARQFYQDTVTTTVPTLATKLAAMLADVSSGGVEDLIIAIGTNDWGDGAHFVSYYEDNIADLVDAIHLARPDATIRLLSPIVRQDEEVPNVRGETLPQYRTALSTIASTRGPWCVYYDASAVLALGDLSDGIHPTAAGYLTLKNYVRDTVL